MAYIKRFGLYGLGILLLSMGIILNTKTAWGVTPLVLIAYCFSELTQVISFSTATLVLYLLYFVAEMLLRKERRRWFDLVQVPFCFIFTTCMSLFAALLPSPESVPLRLFMVLCAVLCVGFGAAIMVRCALIPNPADGLVYEISLVIKRDMGLAKNLMDAVCVLVSLLMGLLGGGRVIGIGFGTLCAVLLTGRAIALCNYLFAERITRIVKAAPIPAIGE